MDDRGLGLVTSVFSVGGLIGSIYAAWLTDHIGRRLCMALNGFVFVAGSLVEGFSNNILILALGRFISGLGAGCSIVVTPLMINEISPQGLRGHLGSMNQVAINLGILLTQILAIRWANSVQWRYLLFTGAVLGMFNAFAVIFIDESPKWLASKGRLIEAKEVMSRLRGDPDSGAEAIDRCDTDDQEQLIGSEQEQATKKVISLRNYIFDPLYRNSLIVVTTILAGQQFCGINSIIFYGVNTIRKVLPQYAVLINCLISLGNAVITFMAAPLVDELGRKPCLTISVSVMGVSSVIMAIGILYSISSISVAATFAYVASFAVGLGPIPFLMISEVTQEEAKSTAQSYGTVINWIATFLVGYLFPIVYGSIGGYVYLVFALICVLFVSFVINGVPETKGHKTYESVWNRRVD
jgi:sugar porter (SP) family MFS transporter